MDYKEYLNVTVLQENKPVTYKSMARSLGMHVNKAKQALYEFSKQHSNVHAVYCLSGTTLVDNQFKIQLVKDTEVEEAQKKYKKLTGIHVYSLCSFNPTDFSVFYAACKDAPKLAMEDRVKYGVLKNTTVQFNQTDKLNLPKKVAAAATPTASPKTLTSQSTASKGGKPSTAATKRKGALNFGPSTTKKQAVTPTSNEKEPVAKAVTKTTPQPPTTEKKAAPRTEDIERRMAKTSLKASDIFSSDDEDDNSAATEARVPIQDNPNEEEDDDIEMEDIEDNNKNKKDDEDIADFMEKDDAEAGSDTPPSTASGKARRKVLKKKTYKNARGLLVTEDVWEWEELDGDNTDIQTTATKPTETAPTNPTNPSNPSKLSKNTKNAKKPAAQSNLFNFFKKA